MVIQLSNLTKSYDEEVVFSNLNLIIDKNLTHIIGINGAGKSTLLKILCGKEDYKGDIYIDDMKVDFSYLSKNTVLVDQDINLFMDKTVKENIKLLAKRIDYNLIEKFGFKDKLSDKTYELSGGYQKKLMLLIALSLKPKILLLDEYTNYLDKDFIEKINSIIVDYSKDNMVIYVDHNSLLKSFELELKNNCNSKDEVLPKIMKTKKKFNVRFTRFDIFSQIVVFLFFILIIGWSSGVYGSTRKMTAEYYVKNEMYFQQAYERYKLSDSSTLFYSEYIYSKNKYDINNILYSNNENIEFVYKDNINEKNYCYVFENNSSLYRQHIEVNSKIYYVAGVVKLDLSKYDDQYIFKSIIIYDKTKVKQINYAYYTKDDMLNNYDYFIPIVSNLDDDMIIFYEIVFVLFINLYMFISVCIKNKNYDIYVSFANTKDDVLFSYTLGLLISTFISYIIALLLSPYVSGLMFKMDERMYIPCYEYCVKTSIFFVLIIPLLFNIFTKLSFKHKVFKKMVSFS